MDVLLEQILMQKFEDRKLHTKKRLRDEMDLAVDDMFRNMVTDVVEVLKDHNLFERSDSSHQVQQPNNVEEGINIATVVKQENVNENSTKTDYVYEEAILGNKTDLTACGELDSEIDCDCNECIHDNIKSENLFNDTQQEPNFDIEIFNRRTNSPSMNIASTSTNQIYQQESERAPNPSSFLISSLEVNEDDDELSINPQDLGDDDDEVLFIEEIQKSNHFATSSNNISSAEHSHFQGGNLPTSNTIRDYIKAKVPRRCLTVHFCCPMPNCVQLFATRSKLNYHLLYVHQQMPVLCPLRGCSQSFRDNTQLSHHIKFAHQTMTKWPCFGCVKEFKNPYALVCHQLEYHQRGQFRCAFENCQKVADYRYPIIQHYTMHRTFACTFPNCSKAFNSKTHQKQHERIHLGIKPYRCKWPGCQYESEFNFNVIKHIKNIHYKQSGKNNRERQIALAGLPDPKIWMEVKRDFASLGNQ